MEGPDGGSRCRVDRHVGEGGDRQGGQGQPHGPGGDLRHGVAVHRAVQPLDDARGQQLIHLGLGQIAAGPVGIRGGLLGVAHAGHDHLQGLAQGHRLVRTEGAVLIPIEHPAGGQLGDLLIIVLTGRHVGEGLGRQGGARVRGPRAARAGVAAARIRRTGGDGDVHRAL